MTTIETLEAAIINSNKFCILEKETVIDARDEIKELNRRLTKEHLPSEYKSWEQVWQRRVEMQSEMDSLRTQNRELRDAVELAQRRHRLVYAKNVDEIKTLPTPYDKALALQPEK